MKSSLDKNTPRELPGHACVGNTCCVALYLRLAKTCLMYYISWERDEMEGRIKIISSFPKSGKRESMLATTRAGGSGECVVIGRVSSGSEGTSGSEKQSPTGSLRVYPTVRVVGTPNFMREDRLGCDGDDVA